MEGEEQSGFSHILENAGASQEEARTWIRARNRGLEAVLPPLEQPLVDVVNPT